MKTRIYAGPQLIWEGQLPSIAGITSIECGSAVGEARVVLRFENGQPVQEINIMTVKGEQ